MSVLAPPPSPTPSCFDAMLSDSDINVDRTMAVNSLKRKGSFTQSTPQKKVAAVKAANMPSKQQDENAVPSSSSASPKEKRKPKESVEPSPEKLREKEEKEAAKAERLKQKEAKRLEREAKELEKQKAKEAKEAELKKAEDLKKKQANLFSSFLKKTVPPKSPTKLDTSSGSASAVAGSSKDADKRSDFERAFLPCQYKNLAPVNRFAKSLSEDVKEQIESEQTTLTREEMLADLRKRASAAKRPSLPSKRKGVHPRVSVREIKRIVTESDVLGGNVQEQAERALEALQDRNKVQIKLLKFGSDRRPGWYGTWTKSTNLIGPRCPLGQDPVSLDYSYDSDAEWEEMGQVEGEDVHDGDEEREESLADSDDDSEMDDWLVDDLEVEDDEPMAPIDVDADADADVEADDDIIEVDAKGLPIPKSITTLSPSVVNNTNILHPKKKKKVKLLGRRFESKLVPFQTGPHWESVFGTCDYEPFSSYRIEFLNDAGFGLNPFTFTSAVHEVDEAGSGGAGLAGEVDMPSKVRKAALPAGGVLASLWATALVDDPMRPPASSTTATATAPGTTTSAQPSNTSTFKHQIKQTAIPHLLNAIEGSTKTRAGLIDDLKELLDTLSLSTSKNAIAERISAYATKEKKPGSPWSVKLEFRHLLA
ncbi:hypothetical protein BCV70DRAFT_214329 [Testicularia cyperi]|uniref:Chromatin assembly factor 1 subunit A dimerization domain-containing protein n=1 Tax=Testicularia cyperi TaxID=1882483 RepID=A0A317XX30_9BASI|nr:hypothetical protein BCV70DRAFT_214329 [Testicularia cyperi]